MPSLLKKVVTVSPRQEIRMFLKVIRKRFDRQQDLSAEEQIAGS
jgi:hypothetical protein